MNSKSITIGILKAVGILAGIALGVYFLYAIKTVLIYVVIAAVISLMARPLILLLRKRLKFPNTLAVIFTMILYVGVTIGIIGLFIPLIAEQSESLSLLQTEELTANLESTFIEIDKYFKTKNIDILDEIKNSDVFSGFREIPNIINGIIGTFGSLSAGLFSVLFISFFFMKDSLLLKRAILILTPTDKERKMYDSLEKINGLLSRYFIGLLLQILILFVIYTIVLLIFGIKNAVVIALLCAILNIIPYVGPIISGLLLIFLTMTSNIGLDFQSEIVPKTIYVMIGFVIAQLVDNLFSQPKIFSTATKAHPLEIFLVIIIGGMLMGAVGMIIAVPSYTVLRVILKEFLSENKIVKSLTKDI